MKNFIDKFEKLLKKFDDLASEKTIGTNYLELLKFEIIDKLKASEIIIFKDLKQFLIDNNNFEKAIDFNNRKINYSFKFYDKSLSTIKYKEKNDRLFIVIEGLKSVTIYDNNSVKKTIYSELSRNMGFVMSLDTVITYKIADKSIILSISFN